MRPNPSLRRHLRATRDVLIVAVVAATLSAGLPAPVAAGGEPPPSVTSFTGPAYTNQNVVTFSLKIDENTNGFGPEDVGVVLGGPCTIGTGGTGGSYTVTLTGCPEGPTEVRLGAHTLTNLSGISGPNAPTYSTVTAIDRTAPTSSVSVDAATTGPNAAYSVFGSPTFADPVSANVSSGVQSLDMYYATGSNMANPTKCGTFDPNGGGPVSVTCTLPTTGGTYWLGSVAHDVAGTVETLTADDSVFVDTTRPTANVAALGDLSNHEPVQFNVSYSEPVLGLSSADFTRTGGCTTAGITGSGPYVLSLSGCPDGPISVTHVLNSVTDLAGNTGPVTAGQRTTTLDTTAPSSSGSIVPNATSASSVSVAYTASDATTGLAQVSAYRTLVDQAPAPILCGTTTSTATTGTVTCSLTDGNWSVYTIATDAALNTELAPAIGDDTILRDGTGPTVVITPDATHTNGAPTFGLVFSEDVTGVVPSDFAVSPAGCQATSVLGSGTDWAVSLTGCPEGEVDLALKALSVTDALGNPGPTSLTAAAPVVVDTTLPTVSSIVLATASDTGRLANDRLTTTTSPVFTMTFSEPLETGPSAGAITFTGSGSAPCQAGTPTGSGAVWSVQVTSCNQGTVALHYEGSTALDLAGNTDPAVDSASLSVTIDTTAPTLTLAPFTVSPTGNTAVTFAVQGNEALDCSTLSSTGGVDFTFTNVASTGAPVTGLNGCLLPVTSSIANGASGATTLTRAASFSVSDDAGNPATTILGSPASVTVDRAKPTATLVPSATAAKTFLMVYALTFTEAVSTPALSAFEVGGTAAECTVDAVDRTGDATFNVTVACSSDGTVTLRLLADTATDQVGLTGPAAPVDAATVTLDTAPPSASGITVTPRTGAALAGTAIPVRITWSASDAGGSGLASAAVDISTDGGATWTPATGTPGLTNLATTMPSSGSVRFRVQVTDHAGNQSQTWSSLARSGSLVQQNARAVKLKGTWTTTRSTRYSGGSARYAKAKGASAAYTFTGRSIALVSANATTRGKAKIYVNGSLVRTIDLKGATRYRSVVWAMTWSSTVTKTVKVVVVGTSGRPRVDVDAFVVLK